MLPISRDRAVVARKAHNLEVVGSTPTPATKIIIMGSLEHVSWKQKQLWLEDCFVRVMLHEHGIVEVTTQRQWRNGTRQFKLPTGQMLATYKSGYVRRCDSSDRVYQINPQYKRNVRWMYLDGVELVTREYIETSRVKIWSGLARLNFLLQYYLKNYKK